MESGQSPKQWNAFRLDEKERQGARHSSRYIESLDPNQIAALPLPVVLQLFIPHSRARDLQQKPLSSPPSSPSLFLPSIISPSLSFFCRCSLYYRCPSKLPDASFEFIKIITIPLHRVKVPFFFGFAPRILQTIFSGT